MITIKNLRRKNPENPFDIIIDRRSILGNSFHVIDHNTRELVCQQYKKWFYSKLNHKPKQKRFHAELKRLQFIHKYYGKLNLFCWCVPKQCHGETIKEYLEKLK